MGQSRPIYTHRILPPPPITSRARTAEFALSMETDVKKISQDGHKISEGAYPLYQVHRISSPHLPFFLLRARQALARAHIDRHNTFNECGCVGLRTSMNTAFPQNPLTPIASLPENNMS